MNDEYSNENQPQYHNPPGAQHNPPGAQQNPQMMYVQAPPTNGLAIAGFVVSFFCSIVGLVLSLVALSQINNSESPQGGKGLAIAGMVISIVALVLAVLYFVFVFLMVGAVGAAGAAAMGGM